jgi:hypothetical protein
MTQLSERPTAITGHDTSSVLHRVTDSVMLRSERYYDQAFFEAEKEVWMHVWQFACHGTEIPNPGDFTEYRILDQSVMLIRQPDGTVKGFHNACRDLPGRAGRVPIPRLALEPRRHEFLRVHQAGFPPGHGRAG